MSDRGSSCGCYFCSPTKDQSSSGRDNTVEEIEILLCAIGASPDEVAATLRRACIRGMRGSTSLLNPIVRYLNQNLDIGGRLEVSSDGTATHLLPGGQLQQASLPISVQTFLNRFHRGLYPDLETEGTPTSTPIPLTRPVK
jgi:hypothetical protein